MLDKQKGAENYVRLSLGNPHPMIKVERNSGNIEPVILKIKPELIYHVGAKYCDRNAIMAGAKISGSLNYFRSINFEVFKKNYDELDIEDKMYYSAEVLVFEYVPIKYIINFDEVWRENRILM